jgi:hypothetical protein
MTPTNPPPRPPNTSQRIISGAPRGSITPKHAGFKGGIAAGEGRGALTSGQRQRHPVDVAVHGVHDEELAALGDLHGVRLDPQLAAVEDCLHSVPALELDHRLGAACCRKQHRSRVVF